MGKSILKFLAALLLGVTTVCAGAQTSHSVTLNWTAGSDDTGFIVYRASGACPSSVSNNPLTTGFTVLATLTAATPASYVDSTVTVGAWCYFVAGTAGGATSVPSNTANPSVLPFPVTGLTVNVK